MQVQVELFGPARLTAGRRFVDVPVGEAATVADVLRGLAEACPALVGPVLDAGGVLGGGHVVNLNGRAFLRDARALVGEGDRLLVLSSAAGGAR